MKLQALQGHMQSSPVSRKTLNLFFAIFFHAKLALDGLPKFVTKIVEGDREV